jgi:hypothetical protein
MSPEQLKERLREIPAPQAVQARERAVADARMEIESRGRQESPARSGWLREHPLAGLAAAALLVVVLLLTPPGRAASAWVGDLVGIGDVGGPPSQKKQGSFIKPGTAVVIDTGAAPDGSRYEWVGYRCGENLRSEGIDTKFEGIGISLQWPGVRREEGGGYCEELEGRPHSGVFTSNGVHILPSQFKGVAEPDLVIEGTTGPQVHRVRVIYRDGEGRQHDLPVDFARVQGKLRKLASQPEPVGTFTAFLPGNIAARDEVESRLDLRALMGTGKLKLGPIGRREREQARGAFEECAPLEPDPRDYPPTPGPEVRKEIERAFRPAKACYDRHMPRGPFEYVAYDARGRVLDRMSEPLVTAMVRPPGTIEAEGREEPGDKRLPHPKEFGHAAKVVMRGRAPDGALFEFYVEQSKYGICMYIWWPYGDGNGAGSCGPELPPRTAYGRRHPERVYAKPFGFLTEAPRATTSRFVSGFARPGVERVEVTFRDRRGRLHQAPVQLRHVTQSMLGKVDASGPFGYWIAFVPRSAGHAPITVTAFGASGERLGAPFMLSRP